MPPYSEADAASRKDDYADMGYRPGLGESHAASSRVDDPRVDSKTSAMVFGHVLSMETYPARVEMETALRYGSSPHALVFITR